MSAVSRPPLLARALLRLLLRGDTWEVVSGDLEECFAAMAREQPRLARRWYRRQAGASIVSRWLPTREQMIENPRESWSMRWEQLLQDVRFGLRSYARSPALVAIIIVTLGLGIGSAVAVFSIVDAALLAPLPYPEAGRLAALYEENSVRGWSRNVASPANFLSWREQVESFDTVSAHSWTTGWAFTGDGGPEWVPGMSVYADFFATFGRPMALGREFTEQENWSGERLVVISHGLWTRAYGRDPQVLGKPIVLDDIERRIIGVAPEGFEHPESGLDIFTPFRWREESRTAEWFRRAHMIWAVGRMSDGVTAESARAELGAIAAALEQEFPGTNENMGAGVVTLKDWVVGDRSTALLVLIAAVGAMLLTACANIASLLLTRANARVREIALRNALGASRGRILRQLVTENLMLSILGGALGVLVASQATPLLVRLGGTAIPRAAEVGMDLRVLGFAVFTTVLTGLVFGLVPSLQAPMSRLRTALREGSGASGSPARERARRTLVVAEVALAVVLVAGAALLLRSLTRLSAIDPGFDPSHLMVAEINLGSAERYPDTDSMNAFIAELRENLEAHPGVTNVAFADWLPLNGTTWTSDFWVEGYELQDEVPILNRRFVDFNYLETMRVPLVGGRGFNVGDGPDSEPVMLINESLAARYFGTDDPVGHRVRFGDDDDDPYFRIVGVVGSEKIEGLDSRAWPEALLPMSQEPGWGMNVIVRYRDGAGRPEAVFREELARVDPRVPIVAFSAFEDRVISTLATERLLAVIGTAFAGITLLLAALGVYGLLAQSVTQRAREIGIRMALGASARQVVGVIMTRSLALVGLGMLIGGVGYLAVSTWLSSVLFELSPTDPGTLALVVLVLCAVAGVAGYLPARRAATLDPARTLRSD